MLMRRHAGIRALLCHRFFLRELLRDVAPCHVAIFAPPTSGYLPMPFAAARAYTLPRRLYARYYATLLPCRAAISRWLPLTAPPAVAAAAVAAAAIIFIERHYNILFVFDIITPAIIVALRRRHTAPILLFFISFCFAYCLRHTITMPPDC